MKKHFILICTCCLFAAACSSSKTNTAANTNAPANTAANTSATKTDAPATSILKPGDVTPDKAVKVTELIDSAAADKSAWKGKEITVTGYVSGTSSSGKNQLITLTNDQAASSTKAVTCAFPGDKPDGIFTKTIEVKGKISFVNFGSDSQTINLEPCEIKK